MTILESVAQTYNTYRRGDHINDDDLELAITELTRVVGLMNLLGERFHHAWWDLSQCLDNLRGYRAARKISQRIKEKTKPDIDFARIGGIIQE
jgi:hypothetical protein